MRLTVEPSLQFWLSFYIRSLLAEIASLGLLLERQTLRQGDSLVTPSFGDNGQLSLKSENDDSNSVRDNQHLREVENLRVKTLSANKRKPFLMHEFLFCSGKSTAPPFA